MSEPINLLLSTANNYLASIEHLEITDELAGAVDILALRQRIADYLPLASYEELLAVGAVLRVIGESDE